MTMKRGIIIVPGSNVTTSVVDNADGTQSVTVNSTASGGSFTAAGDLTGSSSSQSVVSVTGSAGTLSSAASTFSWTSGLTPVLTQASTAVAHDFTVRPQAATGTGNNNGSFVVDLAAPPGSGHYGFFRITRSGSTNPIAQIGTLSDGTTDTCLWLLPSATAQSANNFVMDSDGVSLFMNIGSAGGGFVVNAANATRMFTVKLSSGFTNFAIDSTGSTDFGSAAGSLRIQNTGAAPTTNPAGGGVLFEASGALKHRGSGGAVDTAAASGSGTVNTQQMTVDRRLAAVRTTTNTSTLIDTVPVGANGSTCLIEYKLLGRDTVTGAALSEVGFFLAKNVSGTLSQSSFTNTPGLDTGVKQFIANTSPGTGAYMSVAVSGTNLQLNLVPLTANTADWELLTEVLYC